MVTVTLTSFEAEVVTEILRGSTSRKLYGLKGKPSDYKQVVAIQAVIGKLSEAAREEGT